VEEQQNLTWLSPLQYQAGVVSRQQALDAGFTEKAIECRLRSGSWRRLHRSVYATFTGDLSRDARLWAVVLRVGAGAVLSHETAAEVQHLTDKPSPRIHISVPDEQDPGRCTKIRGVVIHRSRMRWRGWVAAALQDAADGVHSPLERRYVHGVERAHGLPQARRQARRRHGSGHRYLDNLYEPFGLCVELDGNAAHPDEGRWRDTRRDNANQVEGARTLRYGWPDVTEYRCRTAAEIAEVLRRQGWTGTLRRCGPACTAVGQRQQG
jgi:very-short-patch-repair endonuclease